LSDYRVNLDIFAGPLDLLLYLVRRDEVEIYDIPIARITEEYLKYLEMLKRLDIDLAGDFLVMAATLMEIKSAMLLPQAEPDQVPADSAADPRGELIRQLLEYKKFKDAANLLDATAAEHSERFSRPDVVLQKLQPEAEHQLDLDQVSVWDLLEAFDTLIKATGGIYKFDHIKDDTPIDLYQIEILHRLQSEGPMPFERIFGEKQNRLKFIGMFLALLELIRAKLIWAEQPAASVSIYLRALTDEPAEQAVQKAIIAAAEQLDETDRSTEDGPAPIPVQQLPSKTQKPKSAAQYEKVELPTDDKARQDINT